MTDVTSSGNPAECLCNCFYFCCQAEQWGLTGSTVCTDGSCTLLRSETPPWLAFCDWAISVLWWEVWSLNPFCLLLILENIFASFPTGGFHRGTGNSLGAFSCLGLHEFCQLAYFLSCLSCLTHQRVVPSELLLFVSFTASGSGLWEFSVTLKLALTCSIFCVVCIDREI